MVKDTSISIRFNTDHLAALDHMVRNYPESPIRVSRTDVIQIALLQMAERLDAAHGTDFHEVMVEAMTDDD